MSKFQEVINASKPILVDFYAQWCGPCKTLSPILEDVKKEMKNSIGIIKIDVDKNPAIAAKFQVKGVPTLIVFKQGKQLWRQSGVLRQGEIVELMKSFL